VEAALGRRNFFLPQVFHQEKTPSSAFIWGGLGVALVLYLFWAEVIQPHKFSISLIDAFPQKIESQGNDTCLKASPALYPPCIIAWQEPFSLVSLEARTKIPVEPFQTVEK